MTKLEWWRFYKGIIPQPKVKKKLINCTLYYKNGVHVFTGDIRIAKSLKKQHPLALLKYNYE
ncbi:MAG TPA: hypothetical protein PK075_11915 [Chitinophagales bacterium]|nr:hypothetical protein [Chitinophagales bacterium]